VLGLSSHRGRRRRHRTPSSPPWFRWNQLSKLNTDVIKKHVYKKTVMIQTGDILKIKDQWEQCKQYCSQLKANNYHQKTGYKYGTDLNDGRLYARWPRIGKTMTPLAHRVNARKNACSTVSATGG
jgi:hypothetical protein